MRTNSKQNVQEMVRQLEDIAGNITSQGFSMLILERVAKKITTMKDNKSPGVDGILPKLLMEIVEQISIPFARVFNLSLKEGVVPFE